MKYRSPECLNCGNPLELQDRYCSYCGQLNSTKRISLLDYFSEFLGNFFSFDSKLWTTVRNLLVRPGMVTLEFTRGKRLKYANPFRFFLSVSIIYFLLTNFIDLLTPGDSFFGNDTVNVSMDNDDLGETKEMPLDSLLAYIGEARRDTIIKDRGAYTYVRPDSLEQMRFFDRTKAKFELFEDFREATEIKDAKFAMDSLRYPQTRYNIWLYDRADLPNRIEERPFDFAKYLLDKVPFFIFFFTPLFALLFLIFYWKRIPVSVFRWKLDRRRILLSEKVKNKAGPVLNPVNWITARLLYVVRVRRPYTYMEHVIFLFHLFTFIFTGLLICLLPDTFMGDSILAGIFITLVCPFYFYKALRNFYRERRLRTIAKFILLNFFFVIFASLGMAVFVILTAATY